MFCAIFYQTRGDTSTHRKSTSPFFMEVEGTAQQIGNILVYLLLNSRGNN